MAKEVELPDGSIGEFPDAMPDDQIEAVLRRQFGGGQQTPSPPAPPVTPAAVPRPPAVPRHIPDPFTVAGKGLSLVLSPLKKAFDVAGRADVAAGIKTPEQAASRAQTYTNVIPPLLAGILSGGASVPAQSLAQMATTQAMQGGQMEPESPGQVLLSGAMPPVAAGVGRLARGVGRTATRLVPSLFESAQSKAQAAGGELVNRLRPETSASTLFRGARAAGDDVIPAGNIQRKVLELAGDVGDPINPGLQLVKAYTDKLGQATAGGSVQLGQLMQLRRDLGRSLSKAPELKGLYSAILTDLEAAAAAGGPGARQATEALAAFKADLGADLFAKMMESATRDTVAGGQRALNPATLRKQVAAKSAELTRLLGPEKVQMITGYLDKIAGLPPAMAYTMMNIAANSLLGIGGALTGWGMPAGLTMLGAEVGRNAAFAGRNPATLNAILGTAASMGRAGAAPRAGQLGQ